VALTLSVLAAAPGLVRADAGLHSPSPELGAGEVIGIVLEALRAPNEPHEGAGIEQTWRFASPPNRARTGPLERFAEMLRNPLHDDLLGHVAATRGELVVEAGQARQEVEVIARDGSRATYVFQLRRHTTADCKGCWMTDAVILVEREEAEAI